MLLRGKREKAECGTLLHISSLASKYGIGSFGSSAYEFVDFLHLTGQLYWQILPLCPIGEGNSPYKSISCFAGEPLLIDLELLVKEGLLKPEELPEPFSDKSVNYNKVRNIKMPLIKKAAERINRKKHDYLKFLKQNEYWLEDFALFSTIAEINKSEALADFDDALKYRMPKAIEAFKTAYSEEIENKKAIQYIFYSQYFSLKHYANKKSVKIIGDMPFYVSPDSADVWKSPDNFKVGRDLTPTKVAGVPPDIFSSDGQLWGNPIYDWDYQKHTNYAWWKKRLMHNLRLYDTLRIDHFRAFADYYAIPYGAKNAKSGCWEKGAGIAFWNTMQTKLGKMNIIAEDLGGDTKEVEELVLKTGFPNMKVLQFAFSSDLQNKFLPRNYNKNCVCYTGTHDNNTTNGWFSNATVHERDMFIKLTTASGMSEPAHKMIWLAMHSRAKIAIVPMQDWLCLDETGRMNTPGTPSGNWQWQMQDTALSDELIDVISYLVAERK